MCVAVSAFPENLVYRELDDPSTYQVYNESDSVDEESFPEELDLNYRAASAGRNVENIPDAPEPRADEDNNGSRDVSDHGHGSDHHQHGLYHGSGQYNAFNLPVSGYGYPPSRFAPDGYNRYPVYGGYGQGYNRYPAHGGYGQGYNRYPAHGGYGQGYNKYPAYGGYKHGRFATPLHNHGFNAGIAYRPAGYGHSSSHAYSRFPSNSYGRVGRYSRPSVYGRRY